MFFYKSESSELFEGYLEHFMGQTSVFHLFALNMKRGFWVTKCACSTNFKTMMFQNKDIPEWLKWWTHTPLTCKFCKFLIFLFKRPDWQLTYVNQLIWLESLECWDVIRCKKVFVSCLWIAHMGWKLKLSWEFQFLSLRNQDS